MHRRHRLGRGRRGHILGTFIDFRAAPQPGNGCTCTVMFFLSPDNVIGAAINGGDEGAQLGGLPDEIGVEFATTGGPASARFPVGLTRINCQCS